MDPQEQAQQEQDPQDFEGSGSNADFDAGFNDEAHPTATPDATANEPPAEAAPAAPPKYRQITEQEFEELRQRAAAIEATRQQDRDATFGKIGGLERQLQALARAGVGEVSRDDFAELADEFPDLAELTVKGLNRALAKVAGAAPAPAAPVDERVQAALQPHLQRIERRALMQMHPDLPAIEASPEFGAWLGAQKPEVLHRLQTDIDSAFVGEAITAFKASRKPAAANTTAATRKSRLEAAVTPRGSGTNAPASTDEDQFIAGFNAPG